MRITPTTTDHASGWRGARFARGFTYPLRGARLLLTTPRLWPFVLIPAMITGAMLVAAGFGTFVLTPLIIDAIWRPATDVWYWEALWLAARLLVAVPLFVALTIALYFSAGIIAIPFNDRLSARVETMMLGPYEEPFSWGVMLGDLAVSVAHTLLGLALWIAVMVCVLLLNLVPVVGTVASFLLGLAATAFFFGREMMDGAMSRRRLAFLHKLRVVRANLVLMEGFGVATYLMLWVPGLNFICLPCAVAGGTMLYCELELQGLVPNAEGTGRYIPERARIGVASD